MADPVPAHDAEVRHRLERLRKIEAHEDASTVRHLEALGVGPGWRCLEVGAGAGSIARWLRDRVGPRGRVVATDIDTRFLREHDVTGLEIRRHDVVRDPFEPGSFDLVHVRHLLANLPGRIPALKNVAAAVKPGGLILIEEIDFVTGRADPAAPPALGDLYGRMLESILGFTRRCGADPNFGGRVPGLLRALLGFEAVEAVADTRMLRGDPATCPPQQLGFQDLRGPLVDGGHVSPRDFDDFLGLYDDPAFAWWDGLRVTARGRRPRGDASGEG
ncbi:MAG: class I SAM-dependent methyltransferase [Acidobacteriota bacterium]